MCDCDCEEILVMEMHARKSNGVPLALRRAEARGRGTLRVQSTSISGPIPARYSAYAEGISPEISWSEVEGARSYALILEDPDAHAVRPFVHWVAWNIPADFTSLPEGLQDDGTRTEPNGLLQGKTSKGSMGYFGPRPPEGDPPHHYHFQVFALDTTLDVPQGADRDEVLRAMSGHVLAAGELVGTYQQPNGA
jgi:Raf kinase inhibitor-like YbhB/YbcL family protein